MKKLFYYPVMLFLAAFCFAGCSSDDEAMNPLLLNSWVLVSYGNDSDEVLKESEGYYYEITFDSEGRYSGKAYGNKMGGEYECKGSEIKLSSPMRTLVLYENSDPDYFFDYNLKKVYTYTVTDRELRLYYFPDQYFKFRTKAAK